MVVCVGFVGVTTSVIKTNSIIDVEVIEVLFTEHSWEIFVEKLGGVHLASSFESSELNLGPIAFADSSCVMIGDEIIKMFCSFVSVQTRLGNETSPRRHRIWALNGIVGISMIRKMLISDGLEVNNEIKLRRKQLVRVTWHGGIVGLEHANASRRVGVFLFLEWDTEVPLDPAVVEFGPKSVFLEGHDTRIIVVRLGGQNNGVIIIGGDVRRKAKLRIVGSSEEATAVVAGAETIDSVFILAIAEIDSQE